MLTACERLPSLHQLRGFSQGRGTRK